MSRWRAFMVALSLAAPGLGGLAALQEAPGAGPAPVYHENPDDLWNRLHAALFVRTGPDGRLYGADRLEPLLWRESRHLLQGPSQTRAATVLKEFAAVNNRSPNRDPLRCALLQRDLWMIFNARDAAIDDALFAIMGQLALSREQIQQLPDNYAAAVASGRFARRFDPDHPTTPYLPPDLFTPEGPWVCLGRTDGVTAPQHVRPENPYANSVFFTFLNLPGGRPAVTEFLRQFRAIGRPLSVPDPGLPQLPKGSQMALVRCVLLIDDRQAMVASPVTESIQLRFIRKDPEPLDRQAMEGATRTTAAAMERLAAFQSSFEFRLSRAQLLAGHAGGLFAVGVGERDFKTGFAAHSWDEFEQPEQADFLRRSQQNTILESCNICHSLPGIYAFNTLQDFRFVLSRPDLELQPFAVAEMAPADVAAAAIRHRSAAASWEALRAGMKRMEGR